MELFSSVWWSALLAIVLIDLVLAGDNAIVIGLAARRLPPAQQRKAIVWGTVGALLVRAAMTVGVVWLLRLPGLMLVGGLGLLWMAYRLTADSGDAEHADPVVHGFWGAMRTIVVADALMGVDNVLGVAGAAHGAIGLVLVGLLLSVPIMVFGSALVLRLVERWPVIITLGALVLAITAAQMLMGERLLQGLYGQAAPAAGWAQAITYGLAVGSVLASHWMHRRRAKAPIGGPKRRLSGLEPEG